MVEQPLLSIPPQPPVHRMVAGWVRTLARAGATALGVAGREDFFLSDKYGRLEPYYRGRILDLGAGPCDFSAFLRARGHDVVAMDVADASENPEVRPVVFDGRTIPAGSDAFDVGVCMFVLHHVLHQDALLRELVRVVRRTLIIAEDVQESAWDRWMARAHADTTEWGAAATFHSDAEWMRRFEALGLGVRERVVIPRWRLPYYPVLRIVYVLDLAQAPSTFAQDP